jgi:phosphoglycerate kinase
MLVYIYMSNVLKTLKTSDIQGKTILYRSPYDIGVKETPQGYVLKDDSRIKATIPTLKYLLEQNCKIVILTWVKRPNGKIVEKLRTNPHAQRLQKLLNHPVAKVDGCVEDFVKEHIAKMQSKDIVMLENVRFYPEEKDSDQAFSKKLTDGCDFIVYDGFPQAHRTHSSTTGILEYLPSCVGLYFEKEFNALSELIQQPKNPFTIIIGGAKISDKVAAIENLYSKVDAILVGGAPCSYFLAAQGKKMGGSCVKEVVVDTEKYGADWTEFAKALLKRPAQKILTPIDVVVADSLENPEEIKTVDLVELKKPLEEKWCVLDVGPRTTQLFSDVASDSGTVFWNGPVGLFEEKPFLHGSLKLLETVQQSKAYSVIAGGDTVDLLKTHGDETAINHVSLAGGATLDFLSGKEFPVLKYFKS